MKNLLKPSAIVAALLLVGTMAPASAETCGTSMDVILFAGQTIDAGTVTVENDDAYLYVTFTAENGWLLSETHLHVADSLAGIPTNKKGNPKIGNFAYQRSYDPLAATLTDNIYTIPKANLSLDDNNSVTIAAHAVVMQIDDDGVIVESETGWADGTRFVDRGSWATYFQYIWQDCDNNGGGGGESTETGFAFGDEYATCFINADFDGDSADDGFNRWGWSNGLLSAGSYTFGIYAGAGKCDLSKGTYVGDLYIVYEGGTATVTFQMTGIDANTLVPYNLVETHLYIGSEPLPRNGDDYTVAPGQYPTIHGDLENVASDTYTVSGLSGDIYVVAHATVAGFPPKK
ncbi:MAG: hypothetical protein WBH85_02525 [Thermoanaerobaculia bacterium]